jgi:DNA-binding response OmpR family regulator
VSKILVVDDDLEIGRLLRTLFELEGYQVTVASRYENIFPTIQEIEPDVVLMDVRIQGKETIDLMRQIRQELPPLPVVMTSGWDLERACLDAGATRFVMKPFLPGDVIRIVASLLDKD